MFGQGEGSFTLSLTPQPEILLWLIHTKMYCLPSLTKLNYFYIQTWNFWSKPLVSSILLKTLLHAYISSYGFFTLPRMFFFPFSAHSVQTNLLSASLLVIFCNCVLTFIAYYSLLFACYSLLLQVYMFCFPVNSLLINDGWWGHRGSLY